MTGHRQCKALLVGMAVVCGFSIMAAAGEQAGPEAGPPVVRVVDAATAMPIREGLQAHLEEGEILWKFFRG